VVQEIQADPSLLTNLYRQRLRAHVIEARINGLLQAAQLDNLVGQFLSEFASTRHLIASSDRFN
jgi:hypothetical protein